MREVAVRPIGVGVLVDDREDLGDFPVQQPVDRVAARSRVGQVTSGGAAASPPTDTPGAMRWLCSGQWEALYSEVVGSERHDGTR